MKLDQSDNDFRPLPLSTLSPKTGFAKPYFYAQNPVKVSSSAMEVLTDFRFVPAATVYAEVDIETTMQKMIARGVRSLLVIDAVSDVIGLVTARDLLGDRPLEVMNLSDLEFGEVKVSQVMTPAENIEVIPLENVLLAHVGDVVETLKHSGRQHAMVVEVESFSGKAVIRGVFSAAQIARQLGIVLEKHDLTRTFAEIDAAMASQTPR